MKGNDSRWVVFTAINGIVDTMEFKALDSETEAKSEALRELDHQMLALSTALPDGLPADERDAFRQCQRDIAEGKQYVSLPELPDGSTLDIYIRRVIIPYH